MRFSDETLIAYADAELDDDIREEVEAAMATDSDLADAVALQIENRAALQTKLHDAFDSVLVEPIPERLLNVTRSDTSTFTAARIVEAPRPRWSSGHWSVLIIALIVGALLGRFAFVKNDADIVTQAGRMEAGGELRDALAEQSGGVLNRDTGIQIGVSYLAKNGDYCRTFTIKQTNALAGLACRRHEGWAIDVLIRANSDASGAYRMAGAAVPPLILSVVETTIAGDPLDPEQEADARARGWQR